MIKSKTTDEIKYEHIECYRGEIPECNVRWVRLYDVIGLMSSSEEDSERNPNELQTYKELWNNLLRELYSQLSNSSSGRDSKFKQCPQCGMMKNTHIADELCARCIEEINEEKEKE